MQASVAAGLLTGRRAFGTSVLPLFYVVVVEGMCLPIIKWRREVARPALFESAGHWVGKSARELAFETVSRPSGSRPSLDGRDLARSGKPVLSICVYLCDLWAFLIVGVLEVVGASGGATQMARLSVSIRVICGFSWAGGWAL